MVQRLPLNAVYCWTGPGMSFRFTLSRPRYCERSCQAPEEQNLPTMSVEKDSPTSGPLPAPIAWVILSSSCPDLTVTLISGYLAWKSLMTPCRASASRSVKKCQNSMVPEAVTPADAIDWGLLLGVHAEIRLSAAAARLTAAMAPPRRPRFIEGLLSRECGGQAGRRRPRRRGSRPSGAPAARL